MLEIMPGKLSEEDAERLTPEKREEVEETLREDEVYILEVAERMGWTGMPSRKTGRVTRVLLKLLALFYPWKREEILKGII